MLVHQLRGLCYNSGALWLCWYLAINSTQRFCHFQTSTKQFFNQRENWIHKIEVDIAQSTCGWMGCVGWKMNTSHFILCANRSSCVTPHLPAVGKARQAWTPHLVIHENGLGLGWPKHLQPGRTIVPFSLIHDLVRLYKRQWKDRECMKSSGY